MQSNATRYHLLRDGKRNVSGLVSFFFVEAHQLLRDPNRVGVMPDRDRPLHGAQSLVVEELPISPTAHWNQAIVTPFTLSYDEQQQQGRAGEFFRQQVEGVIARQSPELQEVLGSMRRRRYVLITRDRNGYLKLIGSRECPLEFSLSSRTGSSPRERNQVSFRFAGDTRRPSLFVHGNLYDTLAEVERPDLGDTRVLTDGITFRVLAQPHLGKTRVLI